MSVDTMEEMFVLGLKEMYYTEHQLTEALDELASQTSEEEIQQAFEEHKEETQTQAERLEEVFEMIDESPEEKESAAVAGLIEDHEEFVNQDPDQQVLDRFNIAAGQKSEHLEIAAYGNLIPAADSQGLDEVADTLEQNLREEQDALSELSELGERFDRGDVGQQ